MKRLWKDYNLSIVLLVLFLTTWLLQGWTGWSEFATEQQQHGEAAHWFGAGGYVWAFGQSTFENWQSEFLQLFSMVVLTSFLIHKGSAESRDSQDEMQASLSRIEQRLAELGAKDERPRRAGHAG